MTYIDDDKAVLDEATSTNLATSEIVGPVRSKNCRVGTKGTDGIDETTKRI